MKEDVHCPGGDKDPGEQCGGNPEEKLQQYLSTDRLDLQINIVYLQCLITDALDWVRRTTHTDTTRLSVVLGSKTLQWVEQEYIKLVLQECKGNQRAAARCLGISRWSLARRIQKHGI